MLMVILLILHLLKKVMNTEQAHSVILRFGNWSTESSNTPRKVTQQTNSSPHTALWD